MIKWIKKLFKNIIPQYNWEYSQSRTKRNIAKILDVIEAGWALFVLCIIFFSFGATIYFFGKKLIQYVFI